MNSTVLDRLAEASIILVEYIYATPLSPRHNDNTADADRKFKNKFMVMQKHCLLGWHGNDVTKCQSINIYI